MRKRTGHPPLPLDRGVGPTRVRLPGPGAADPVLLASDGLPASAVSYVMARFPSDAEWFSGEVAAGRVCSDDGTAITCSTPYVPGASAWFHRPIPDDHAAPVTLDVLYEDQWVVAVDKPHGLCSTPKGEHVRRSAVVAGRVQFHNDQISALHRLDRSTGGVLLLCKHAADRGAFHRLFEQRAVSKTYWAVAGVNHRVGPESVRVESRISKIQGELQAREEPGEVNAVTDVRMLSTFTDARGEWGLYEVRPLTGRTHQIRVHMSSLGLPLRGDKLYPVAQPDFHVEDPDNPMQLIARSMTFVHPMTGEPVTINSRLTPSSHTAAGDDRPATSWRRRPPVTHPIPGHDIWPTGPTIDRHHAGHVQGET